VAERRPFVPCPPKRACWARPCLSPLPRSFCGLRGELGAAGALEEFFIVGLASVASWTPFSQLGYGTRPCAVVNVTELQCTTASATSAGNIFGVVFQDLPGVYVAVAEAYRFFTTLNATAQQRLAYPVNASVFLSCYAPAAPLSRSGGSVTCSNASLISYPSSGGVFLNSASAAYSQSLWLGLWIAFLCVFLICVPVLVVTACSIWQASNDADE
jgi:hypothetical protein